MFGVEYTGVDVMYEEEEIEGGIIPTRSMGLDGNPEYKFLLIVGGTIICMKSSAKQHNTLKELLIELMEGDDENTC